MKKLLVVLLVVALTLSLTIVASAAALSAYVGGRLQWSYISTDEEVADNSLFNGATKNAPATIGNSGLKMLLQGTVKDDETNTWATIGTKIDGWPNAGTDRHAINIFDLGINKVGGSNVNVWYTSWENQNMKRGMAQLWSVGPNQYHDDPVFNQTLGQGLGVDYISDNVVVNFGYDMNKNANDKNVMIVAGTFKFDGGDVHVAMRNGDDDKSSQSNIGGTMKFGFGDIALDYLSNTTAAEVDSSLIQVKATFTDLKFDVTLLSDGGYYFNKSATDSDNSGMGFLVRYTGLADGKVVLAYKSVTADEKVNETLNFTDMYIGYKFGVFETRAGMGTKGEGSNNSFTYLSCYASLW